MTQNKKRGGGEMKKVFIIHREFPSQVIPKISEWFKKQLIKRNKYGDEEYENNKIGIIIEIIKLEDLRREREEENEPKNSN